MWWIIHHQTPLAVRALALEFAVKIQPRISSTSLQDIADALNGSPEFGSYACNVTPPDTRTVTFAAPKALPTAAATWYADPVSGSDSNDGSLSAPFRSIARAVAVSRVSNGVTRTIFLRSGTFYLPAADQGGATIVLGAADSGLSIAAYPGDPAGSVWVSGAVPLPALAWQRVPARPGNVWRAQAPRLPAGWPGLRFNGSRLIRA